jgi:hypothetical protein
MRVIVNNLAGDIEMRSWTIDEGVPTVSIDINEKCYNLEFTDPPKLKVFELDKRGNPSKLIAINLIKHE